MPAWVTVLITNDKIDADLKKGLLENAGIECVIEAVTFSPYALPLQNSIKLNVRQPDFETAKSILSGVP